MKALFRWIKRALEEDNERPSHSKPLVVAAFFVATYVVIHQELAGTLSEWVLGFYLGSFVTNRFMAKFAEMKGSK